MMEFNDDIIKEIFICCDLEHLKTCLFINKQWYSVIKIYKQYIAKSIFNRFGYRHFKKNTNCYLLLMEFLKYDKTLQKNIVKSYIDHKYTICKFIINNITISNFNLDYYLSLNINTMVDSIRDFIFINNKKGDPNLLIQLIFWKLQKHSYNDPYDDLSVLSFEYQCTSLTNLFIIKNHLIVFDMNSIRMNLYQMLLEYNTTL